MAVYFWTQAQRASVYSSRASCILLRFSSIASGSFFATKASRYVFSSWCNLSSVSEILSSAMSSLHFETPTRLRQCQYCYVLVERRKTLHQGAVNVHFIFLPNRCEFNCHILYLIREFIIVTVIYSSSNDSVDSLCIGIKGKEKQRIPKPTDKHERIFILTQCKRVFTCGHLKHEKLVIA
jgi:hypothetical protein